MLEFRFVRAAFGLREGCSMGNGCRVVLSFVLMLAGLPAFGQSTAAGGPRPGPTSSPWGFGHGSPMGEAGGYYPGAFGYGGYYPGFGYNDFFPGFGGAGFYPSYTSPLEVPPPGWWASPYPSQNPCQAGCNPNAGYEWESVGTLILNTNPPTARISLDGIPAGTTDKLGPFQLPVGEHTLHVDALGFESADVVVKFEQPGVQTLNVELKRLAGYPKPAPQP